MRRSLTLAALVSLFSVAACAESEQVRLEPPSDGGAGVGGMGDGGTGAGGDTGLGGAEEPPPPPVCDAATAVYEATPVPSNVLFLVDRSGSMHLAIDEVDTRWSATKAGFFSLLDALPSTLSAGMTVFPSGDAPVDCCQIIDNVIKCYDYCAPGELPGPEARCDASAYEHPHVALGALDAARKADMKALASTVDDEFYWGTPLAPALAGAIGSLEGMPQGVSSVVLLTDGNPTSCETSSDAAANDIQRVIDAAAAGFGGAQPIRTFVMGVIDGTAGANAANLSLVAEAGGTARYPGCADAGDCAYSIDVGTFAADFEAALDAIALEAFDCTFEVPSVEGGAPDYDALNLTVTDENGVVTVPRDTSHTAGWDYLPGQQQIQLYGEACASAKAATATVQIVLGCATVQ